MVTSDLFAGGAVLGFGGKEEALRGPEGAVVVGSEFEAFASWFAFAIGARVNEEALVELGLAVFATELVRISLVVSSKSSSL